MDLQHLWRFWLWDKSQWMTFLGLLVTLTSELTPILKDYPEVAHICALVGACAMAFNRSLVRPPNP